MSDTLKWRLKGELFEDGSQLSDWQKIEQSAWQWQYDTHELAFDIYEHDGDYWKLYRARWVPKGATEYVHDFGGQACRMMLVEYQKEDPATARREATSDSAYEHILACANPMTI